MEGSQAPRKKRKVILLRPPQPKPQPKPTTTNKVVEQHVDDEILHALPPDWSEEDEEDEAIIKEPSIIRKSLLYIYLVFNNCSTHGLVYITDKNVSPLEKVMWAVCVCLATWGALSLGLSTYTRYMESPVVMSMERDRMSWNTTFPSITICPLEAVSIPTLESNIQSALSGKTNYDMVKYLEFISNATLEELVNVPLGLDIKDLPPKMYLDLIYRSRTFMQLDAGTGEGGWQPSIEKTIIEGGQCYTFHTFVGFYNSFEYWNKGSMSVQPPKHPELTGHPAGGTILVSVTGIERDVKMTINSPYEIPDMSNSFTICQKKKILVQKIGVLATVTTPEAISLSISQRKCRMPYENILKITPVYSYSFCRMECRIRLAYRYCKCRPFFYKQVEEFKVTCNETGLLCVGKMAEHLKRLTDPNTNKPMEDCICLPLCNEISYFITELNYGDAADSGAAIQVGLDIYPTMRIKRDVIFGFADLLVSIGGTGGLFLGCSLLSIAEILYFATLRLLLCGYKLYKQWRLDSYRAKLRSKTLK